VLASVAGDPCSNLTGILFFPCFFFFGIMSIMALEDTVYIFLVCIFLFFLRSFTVENQRSAVGFST
jgi:hypothetical protein